VITHGQRQQIGPALARLSTANAGFVRDSAEVYKLVTAHLAR